jgi:DNA-binding PadR family transcriptional regulator
LPYYAIRYSTVRNNVTTDPNLLILASLAEGDKHGYAIIQDVQHFAGVRLGAGTLYGAITRLESLGWIRPLDSEDRRKPYRITALGRNSLEEQVDALERVVRTAQRRLQPA